MHYRRKCPFCITRLGSVGSRENISINVERGTFYCYRCHMFGRLTKRNAELLDVPAINILSDTHDTPVEVAQKPIQDTYPGYVPLYPWEEVNRSVVLRPYLRYLLSRVKDKNLLEIFRIGVILDSSGSSWYDRGSLIFPILDTVTKGYILRSRAGEYRMPKGFDRRCALFNGRVLRDNRDTLYVVEGIFDAMVLTNAVAILGSGITAQQFDRLCDYPGTMVFAFDGDAWKASMVAARRARLRGRDNVYWIKLPPGEDPNSVGVRGLELRK